ncbi:MAG: hypothetical protein PUC46_01975, partial [Lachnospiraceae bacterium]|nr:hypothetical protein [Lachnospiraceae bacterium]
TCLTMSQRRYAACCGPSRQVRHKRKNLLWMTFIQKLPAQISGKRMLPGWAVTIGRCSPDIGIFLQGAHAPAGNSMGEMAA